MVIGRRTAAASISERSRRPLRFFFALTLAMVGLLAMGPARAAGDVYVLQDGTPLASKPGVGGRILLWVDTGFPLTAVGRDGDWLKVSSSRFKSGRDTLWVPAARVGSHLPGARSYTAHGGVRVRTNGPWGSADGVALPTIYVVLRNVTNFPFPPGNPVPPLRNPMPALGNPVPALDNPVPPFQQSPVPAP